MKESRDMIRAAAWGLWVLFVVALALASYFGANPPEGGAR